MHTTYACFVLLKSSKSDPVALVGSISVMQLTILSKSNTTASTAMKCPVNTKNLMGRVTCARPGKWGILVSEQQINKERQSY